MSVRHVQHDREGLARLEARLGIEGAVAFFDAVADPIESYELGLAVGAAGDAETLLLSYNPRSRLGDFRERGLCALAQAGLDTGPAVDLFARVDALHGSTVVGLEWTRGGGLGATVYVEELTRFLGADGAERVAREVAEAHGQVLDLPPSGGELYILAVDVPGPVVKVYRVHGTAPAEVMGELGLEDPELLAPGASAYIEQWHLPSQKLKVYRCYDYAQRGGHEEEAAVLYGTSPPWSRVLFDELAALMQRPVRVTSVGRRYAEPPGRSVYWCASGPGVR